MTETSFATPHLSEVITTEAPVDDADATGKNTTTSSYLVDFYVECAIIVTGIVGTAANALVLYALVNSKQHKKHVLIVNQNILDLASCVFVVVIYTLKISNIKLRGSRGYWLCLMLLSENLLWFALEGSMINLAIIAIERYLKVVHAVWSKTKMRKWMIYLSMSFPWIITFTYNMALSFTTSAVIDGVCHGVVVWDDHVAKIVHGVWHFLSFYAIILLIIIFCYVRILVKIRRQARVMACHSGASVNTVQQTTAQAQQAVPASQIQSSVTKTMILICALFAIAWLPENVYYLLVDVGANLTFREVGYYAVVFISFLYVSINPFIYAIKFDPVKRSLLNLIPCKKNQQPTDNIEIAARGSGGGQKATTTTRKQCSGT